MASLGFVAHTERHSSANPNICSFREHKRVVQRPKLGNRKVSPQSAMGGHRDRRNAYFNDFEPGERRYHHRPGPAPNLRRPGLLRSYEVDSDLEADSLAFHVLELPEGPLGDINGTLDASRRSISKTFARSKLGRAVHGKRTCIVGLCRGNVHQSRGIGIGDDVGRWRCGA
jgi:hypothetical protein